MARKVDTNHTRIVKYLREIGFSVIDTHALPKFVDCVVGMDGYTALIEIKPVGKFLNATQEEIFASFDGWIDIVHDEDDCLRLKKEFKDLSGEDEL